MVGQQVNIDGVIYDVLSQCFERETKHGIRREFALKRPRGRKVYHAVLFENGVWSKVV